MAQVGANWPGLLVVMVDGTLAPQGAVRLACGQGSLRQRPDGTPVDKIFQLFQ
jgi:hypothetical protein